MEILRTPDERFADLPDYPFDPHYAEVTRRRPTAADALRRRGPARRARPVLLLHGEPSWSYLYRTMIPPLRRAGLRVVAPDLVGFGRSDKPAAREDYTYARHVELADARWSSTQLDLRDVVARSARTGAGCSACASSPSTRSASRASSPSNTFLPTGDRPLGAGVPRPGGRSRSRTPDFPVGRIVDGGTARDAAAAEIAPTTRRSRTTPTRRARASSRCSCPTTPDDPAAPANRAAWEVLERFDKPFLSAFGDSDPITRGADARAAVAIPGAAGQPHATLEGAAHFSQEDARPAAGRGRLVDGRAARYAPTVSR